MIQLDTNARRRFYEPIILTKALTDIYRDMGSSRPPDPVEHQENEAERLKSFMNRIANVCDNINGGTTVSATAILQDGDGIVYLLASNQVSYADSMKASELVTNILEKISGVSSLDNAMRRQVKAEVLRMVLVHNWKRIRLYMRALVDNAAHCFVGLELQGNTDVRGLLSELAEGDVGDAIKALKPKDLNETTFLNTYASCIRSIRSIQNAPGMLQLIRERVRQDRSTPRGVKSSECWSELRHHMSRLFAYEHMVDSFLEAEGEWPELFRDFDSIVIPSSQKDDKPLNQTSNTASKIIGRMTSDVAQMEQFRTIAAELQKFDFDGRIKSQISSDSFRPSVHAEVLVLDFITRNCPSSEFQYFRGIKYIGSSKPTCKLCSYYFEAHPSRVQSRPTHGNLYKNWKFPDILAAHGNQAVEARKTIYTSVIGNIRKDAFQIMEDKLAPWKRHDSNTYSVMTRQTNRTVDELGDRLRSGLSLRGGLIEERQEEGILDDEDGGARLT